MNLIKKITLDLINSISDLNAKSAALYIIGEFCEQIPQSTEIISYFVENFSNVEMNSKIRLQILNSTVKNFLTKPDEGEELVKICLQKGTEESENPDIRDRAYIYWRLLSLDPNIAKEMACSEKPAFKFIENDEFDVDTIDDMINNMTNVSACYFKKEKDIINEEDMVVDEEARKEKAEKEQKEGIKPKKEKKKKKKKKKKDTEEEQINEADLIGLGVEDEIHTDNKNKDNEANINIMGNDLNNDIFGIFNNPNINNENNPNQNTNNLNASAHISLPESSLFGLNDIITQNTQPPKNIFEDADLYPTTKLTPCYNQDNIIIYSQFQRANGLLQLGLYFVEGGKNNTTCNLTLNKNSFGLVCAPFSEIRDNISLFPMKNNQNNADRKPPNNPFIINAVLQYDNKVLNIKLVMNICVLYMENLKLVGQPFVEFYTKNNGQEFNNKIYSYDKYNNEEDIKNELERINILFSAKQGKENPPKNYFSANILGSMPFLVEMYIDNGIANIKIIANNPSVVPLIKESIDYALS